MFKLRQEIHSAVGDGSVVGDAVGSPLMIEESLRAERFVALPAHEAGLAYYASARNVELLGRESHTLCQTLPSAALSPVLTHSSHCVE